MGASETINIPAEGVVRFQDAILEGFQAAIDKEENCDLQVRLISLNDRKLERRVREF